MRAGLNCCVRSLRAAAAAKKLRETRSLPAQLQLPTTQTENLRNAQNRQKQRASSRLSSNDLVVGCSRRPGTDTIVVNAVEQQLEGDVSSVLVDLTPSHLYTTTTWTLLLHARITTNLHALLLPVKLLPCILDDTDVISVCSSPIAEV